MKEKVLVADDEKDIRDLLALLLEDLGYEVIKADDGLSAFSLFQEKRPSIILTDIKMPGMDGIQLLKRVKTEDKDVEVIMISGHGDMGLAIESLKHEAADFITKPFDDALLAHALQKVQEKIALKRDLRAYTENLESLVREKSARLQQLFDEVPCYVTVQDRDLKITEANRHFKEDFGFESGMSCYKAYKHRDEPCPDCPILQTFEDGLSHQAETVVTARNGENYNTLIWTAPLTDSRGEVARVIEMSTNITRIRQLQDHIASMGMMLGSMSHGLRGLLMALDGGIYRIESGLGKQNLDEIRSGWDMLRLRIERIRKMVLDVLYYAKSRDLDISQIDLPAFASELVSLTGPKAEKAGVRFTTDLSGAEGTFEADATALSSALVNFLENAVDACQVDRVKQEHAVTLSVKRTIGHVLFAISDNGIGMDQETKNNMFTLFFSSKGSRGTGIGLFVSNQVVNQHHGRITVESAHSRGTSIRVEIPEEQPKNPKSLGYAECSEGVVRT
ncbi:MAG: histidine kinase [Deltaproteobacteria bacterium HGW-Deltaproteobacteria-21]|nr:MAG: histidine kinase [Deltaproteobacteria bacterium HGW-Deltaproteobacteria-21]